VSFSTSFGFYALIKTKQIEAYCILMRFAICFWEWERNSNANFVFASQYKGFLLAKMCQIMRNVFLQSLPYLDNRFKHVTKIKQNSSVFLFSLCSVAKFG
jgi:hypothetical protein